MERVIKCIKCGDTIDSTKDYWTWYHNGREEPVCKYCAYFLKESAGRMRTISGVRLKIK